MRDGVKAAGVDQTSARPLCGRVVTHIHPVHEFRLAGEVDVVGTGLGTGSDHRFAISDVRPDRGDDDT
jgi:hypothetical protein